MSPKHQPQVFFFFREQVIPRHFCIWKSWIIQSLLEKNHGKTARLLKRVSIVALNNPLLCTRKHSQTGDSYRNTVGWNHGRAVNSYFLTGTFSKVSRLGPGQGPKSCPGTTQLIAEFPVPSMVAAGNTTLFWVTCLLSRAPKRVNELVGAGLAFSQCDQCYDRASRTRHIACGCS